MNIVDRVLFQCKLNPPAIALGAPGSNFEIVSYARLERSIHSVCRKALALGLARGNLVALFVMDPVLQAIIILALMRLGIVTVTGRSPQLPSELSVDALITDITFPYQAKRIILADPDWTVGEDTPLAIEQVPQMAADDVCRLALTSGTTGEAKAVAITHRNLSTRIARNRFAFGRTFPSCARTFCDFGFAAAPTFQYMLHSLSRGGALFFCGDLESAVNVFDFYRVQNVITAPAGLAKLVESYERRNSLPLLDMIQSGGSALPKGLAERVRARICPNLFESYGATETAVVAVAPAHVVAHIPGAVGYVLPDVMIETIDVSGNALPAGKEGILRIRSSCSVDRYVGDPDTSAKVFRDGWFYPGDSGYLTADGILVVTGREESVLNLGGAKVKPEFVEQVLTAFSGIEQAAVFSLPNAFGNDELWAAVVARSELDGAALRTHCEAKLPPAFIPVRIARLPDLPRNQAGKIDRARLAEFLKARAAQN